MKTNGFPSILLCRILSYNDVLIINTIITIIMTIHKVGFFKYLLILVLYRFKSKINVKLNDNN